MEQEGERAISASLVLAPQRATAKINRPVWPGAAGKEDIGDGLHRAV